MRQRLAVAVTVGGGGAKAAAAATGLGRWLSGVVPVTIQGSLGVAIVTDRRMQELNLRYRHKNLPTDVLSFPSTSPRNARLKTRVAGPPDDGFWGEIAIAAGVASRQAQAEGHSLKVELRVLALHGLLHLLGYDHEVDKGRMGRVEERMRRRAGLPTGAVARAGR